MGAHHQNGVAEACIKVSTLGVCTLLLHAQRLWPEAIITMLWPFALLEFIWTQNHYNFDKTGKSPYMKFALIDLRPSLGDQHPLGCAVYVLESKLHNDFKGLPKWEPCLHLGIYLGHSPVHAGSVALLLNPGTGHVSPQYHLAFDDNFTTVSNMRDGSIPSNWKELVENSSFSSTEEQFSLADVWLREIALSPDNLDSAPLLPSVNPRLQVSKGASAAPAPPEVFEGARNVEFSAPDGLIPDLPLASKGDPTLLLCTPVCEGVALQMPPMINLAWRLQDCVGLLAYVRGQLRQRRLIKPRKCLCFLNTVSLVCLVVVV